MAPTVPFLVLTVVFFLGELREKFLAICCLLMVLPGIFFLVEVYGKTDIRLRASQWMGLNLKPGAVIITEAGNVVDLPLFNNNNFEMINLDLYHLDENPLIADKLDFYLDKADYILIPSRRIFANHLRRKEDFPQAAAYYQRLFSGESGFRMIKEISPFPKWQQWLLGNDLVAEETWTVFDHPTIRIFARI